MIEPLISQSFLSSSINWSITFYTKKKHILERPLLERITKHLSFIDLLFLIFKDNSFIQKGHTESSKNSTVIHPVVFQLSLLWKKGVEIIQPRQKLDSSSIGLSTPTIFFKPILSLCILKWHFTPSYSLINQIKK